MQDILVERTAYANCLKKGVAVKDDILEEPDPVPPTDDVRTQEENAAKQRIYDAVMRGGGEPFGRPFAMDLATLTSNMVKRFNQRGFFGFGTFEKSEKPNQGNIFTRFAATRFRRKKDKK